MVEPLNNMEYLDPTDLLEYQVLDSCADHLEVIRFFTAVKAANDAEFFTIQGEIRNVCRSIQALYDLAGSEDLRKAIINTCYEIKRQVIAWWALHGKTWTPRMK